MAQQFNCSSTTEGLGNCSYDSFLDTQCYVGPHVAGVRCTESKSLHIILLLILANMLNKTCMVVRSHLYENEALLCKTLSMHSY